MGIYDGYAMRARVGAGVAIKRHQAKSIFFRAMRCLAAPSVGGVFEIGPGDGYIAELTQAEGLAYTAIEGSSGVADSMRARGFDVLGGYVPPMPAGLKSGYRACFLLHVIEHMKSPLEAAQLVSDIRDHLVPGGVLAIACPDASRWGGYFHDCDYTHAYPLTRRRLAQLLRDQGMEVVAQTLYTGPVFGMRGLPIAWLAKMLYWPLLDDLIGPARFNDVYNRGFLTFLPNILMIARRPVK